MIIRQISAFLENKSGRLAEVTKILAEKDINILAMSIADTTNFGILRLIVSDYALAEKTLSEVGMTVSVTNVIAIAVEDKPGGLAGALAVFDKENIGIEYLYAFVEKYSNEAYIILKVEEPEKAVASLLANGIKVLESGLVNAK
ncbi:MAG: ACT domain-containing protein [Clostridia bacterium]